MLTAQAQASLVAAAAAARQRAYAPYSNYQVGAALLTSDGEMYAGCNVENASFGLTICAERAALFSAVAAGHRTFTALALVTADGGSPCGACRQVLAEFSNDLPIVIAQLDRLDSPRIISLATLLPERFQSAKGRTA
jgi:cytidine deaminase